MAVKTKIKKSNKKQDLTPRWDNSEEMSASQFSTFFRESLQYYNLLFSGNELKPKVVEWMTVTGFPAHQIKKFKNSYDWRVTSTMGAIAANLLKGMPESRDDFNQGRNCAEWLKERIVTIIEKHSDEQTPVKSASTKQTVSVQDRLYDVAINMSSGINTEYEKIISNVNGYNIKTFKPLHLLKTAEAKAAHARIIKNMYDADFNELTEVIKGRDDDLIEAYSHLTPADLKKLHTFLKELIGACSMIMQEGKVARAPRTKKPKSKDKLVEKLNYKKSDETLHLVSVNPYDILTATELWTYNIKTKKLGRYVAETIDPKNLNREGTGLSIKGTTIIGYDQEKSIQKTLRKPQEQLKAFLGAGKVTLRTFLDNIKAVDIKLNGRINPDIILLKVVK